MTSDSTVVSLHQPEAIDDPLTAILRSGARRLLAQAVEAEAEAFLAGMRGLRLPDGRERLVRHGLGPERQVQTGIGPVPVQRVKLRDRGAGPEGERIRFSSALLPRWARRTRSLDALLPVLYLRGVSMGDFQEALGALLGKEAPNLSPSVIARLRGEWEAEHARWQQRDLSARRYVYLWADGIYLQARMEPQAECMLVLIGATPEGNKELVGFQVGVRESAQSWRELLVDLKARGLAIAPELATGDGALGFWKALEEVCPTTRHQRCWVHKTVNVMDKLPKSVQPAAKQDLREIWHAPGPPTHTVCACSPCCPTPATWSIGGRRRRHCERGGQRLPCCSSPPPCVSGTRPRAASSRSARAGTASAGTGTDGGRSFGSRSSDS